MSENPEEIITGTIDDYLLALADGIASAQEELNRMSVQTAPGQPAIHYHLPKLDFELKMSFNLETEKATTSTPKSGSPQKAIASKFRRNFSPRLRAMPVNPESSKEHFSSEAVSTISGSFVALPVNGGKPPNILGLRTGTTEPGKVTLTVSLKNALGEAISNQAVTLEIDRDFSESLNTERKLPVANRPLQPNTDFQESSVITDDNGEATATLIIDGKEHAKASIVVEAYAGELNETLIVQVKS